MSPYIPTGFYYVGGTWDTGLVISDSVNDLNAGENETLMGNQFVWIPVDGTNVTYARWAIYGTSPATARDLALPLEYLMKLHKLQIQEASIFQDMKLEKKVQVH